MRARPAHCDFDLAVFLSAPSPFLFSSSSHDDFFSREAAHFTFPANIHSHHDSVGVRGGIVLKTPPTSKSGRGAGRTLEPEPVVRVRVRQLMMQTVHLP